MQRVYKLVDVVTEILLLCLYRISCARIIMLQPFSATGRFTLRCFPFCVSLSFEIRQHVVWTVEPKAYRLLHARVADSLKILYIPSPDSNLGLLSWRRTPCHLFAFRAKSLQFDPRSGYLSSEESMTNGAQLGELLSQTLKNLIYIQPGFEPGPSEWKANTLSRRILHVRVTDFLCFQPEF